MKKIIYFYLSYKNYLNMFFDLMLGNFVYLKTLFGWYTLYFCFVKNIFSQKTFEGVFIVQIQLIVLSNDRPVLTKNMTLDNQKGLTNPKMDTHQIGLVEALKVNIRGWLPSHRSGQLPVSSAGRSEANLVSYTTWFVGVEVTIFRSVNVWWQ